MHTIATLGALALTTVLWSADLVTAQQETRGERNRAPDHTRQAPDGERVRPRAPRRLGRGQARRFARGQGRRTRSPQNRAIRRSLRGNRTGNPTLEGSESQVRNRNRRGGLDFQRGIGPRTFSGFGRGRTLQRRGFTRRQGSPTRAFGHRGFGRHRSLGTRRGSCRGRQ